MKHVSPKLSLLTKPVLLMRFVVVIFCFINAAQAALPLDKIKLPPGFEITVFAENVKDARSLALGDNGTLFVGTRSEGKVYAIRHDGKQAQQIFTIASGLNMPNGVAFRNGALYVAEVNRVLRFDNIEANLERPGKPVVINDQFPSETHHGWKFIQFGPDGLLYVPIGAPCNICDRGDPYASITRIDVDKINQQPEIVARGIRNTVGFDWQPQSKKLWFTDNGRDLLGDDVPPDELNRISRAGEHFGYPYCHAGTIEDPEFGAKHNCKEFVAPFANLQAHSANLGVRFYTGNLFPAEYRNQLFIAQHGSWNRSKKVGYRLIRVDPSKSGDAAVSVFAEGWLQGDETVLGRPVDVQLMPDGALLVSDDTANAIYRIGYHAPK
ncbi:MAG: sorbosone dehydrogenase [Verrucomicrobiaceae bacterium]|nr:sorbosone dehydrogenase [Verrucomicrobiaceae bacterium]